jgi:hypothetical protein
VIAKIDEQLGMIADAQLADGDTAGNLAATVEDQWVRVRICGHLVSLVFDLIDLRTLPRQQFVARQVTICDPLTYVDDLLLQLLAFEAGIGKDGRDDLSWSHSRHIVRHVNIYSWLCLPAVVNDL